MRAAIGLVSLLVLAACAADAQPAQGGASTQRNFDVGAFDAVSLGGPHNVLVTVGGSPAVRAEGDAEMIERLDIRVENGELKIGTRNNRNWTSLGRRNPVTIHVTAPALRAASIGGSGDIRIDRVEGPRFAGSIGGSGNIDVPDLRVAEANFSIAGSGNIRAAGAASRVRVSVAGSGDVNLAGLASGTASVSVVGSGDVRARASQTADVSIMGSGDVELSGGARCSIRKHGSGDVRCG